MGTQTSTNDNPLVSVLVATYKPKWLREALHSALSQTYQHLEVLVLDDEPSPVTAKLVSDHQDKRVRYLPTLRNLGPGGTHRRGLARSRGPLISILNHDDLWEPQLLERLVGALGEHPSAVVAFSDVDVITADGEVNREATADLDARYPIRHQPTGLLEPILEVALKQQAIPIAQAAVFRTDAVRGIPSTAGSHYDFWLAYELARTGRGAVHVPGRLGHWRQSDDNLTAQRTMAKQWEELFVFSRLLADPAIASLRGWIIRRLGTAIEGVARVAIRDLIRR